MLKKIQETTKYINGKIDSKPEFGIVLGTGLGGLVKEIEVTATIPYKDIHNFPVSTVPGHEGKLIFGLLGGKNVVAMQGRFHFYEGYSMQEIAERLGVTRDHVYYVLSKLRAHITRILDNG